MERNQSMNARILRVAIGLILLSLAFLGPKTAWGLIGVFPLLAGMTGFDPIYRVFGVNTHRSWPSTHRAPPPSAVTVDSPAKL